MIGVLEIRQSPNQTRQVEGTPELDAGIEELAQSIRENGLVEPLVVRRGMVEGGPGLHVELIAGHRRLAACKRAGLGVVPCYVRDVDGAAAADLTVIENLQRRDLTPIEEAAGVARLLELRGEDAGRYEAVAASLGKSVRWVFRRASLARLTVAWRSQAEKYGLSAAYLEKVARLPAAVQAEVLKGLGEDYGVWARGGDMAVLEEEILVSTRELSRAPWAGCGLEKVCGGCGDRSDAQADLFEDMEGAPRCLNKVCFERKLAEFVRAAKKQLAAKHATVMEAPTKSAYLYSEKKDAGHTVPVLITEGSKAGALLWAPSKQEAEAVKAGAKPQGPDEEEKESLAYVRAVCACIENAGPVWDEAQGRAVPVGVIVALAVSCGVNALAVDAGTHAEPMKINRGLSICKKLHGYETILVTLWMAARKQAAKEL